MLTKIEKIRFLHVFFTLKAAKDLVEDSVATIRDADGVFSAEKFSDGISIFKYGYEVAVIK